MRIIQAGPENLDDVARLFSEYREFYAAKGERAREKAFLRERMANGESVIFIAYEDYDENRQSGEAIGFIQMYPTYSSVSLKRDWILNDLYVDKNARQRGVGRSLMIHAVEFARSTNAKGVTLCTQVENAIAKGLYESLEFEPDENFDHYKLRF